MRQYVSFDLLNYTSVCIIYLSWKQLNQITGE